LNLRNFVKKTYGTLIGGLRADSMAAKILWEKDREAGKKGARSRKRKNPFRGVIGLKETYLAREKHLVICNPKKNAT
jgi:hypothetical protein